MDRWDTSGRYCALIRRRCPGRGIFHQNGGCPDWCDGEPIEHTVGGVTNTEMFKGCQRLLLRPLLRGVAESSNSSAAAVESARNVIASGIAKTVGVMQQKFDFMERKLLEE